MGLGAALNGDAYKPVNPKQIVDGPNNNWAQYAKVNVDLIDNYQARVFIRNNETGEPALKRQTVDENLFKRPVLAHEARLS